MSREFETPLYVIEALEAVRASGKHNMHFASDVFREMFNMGFYNAVSWLSKHKVRTWYNEFGEEEEESSLVVDLDRYSPALMELGEIRSLADTLIED